MDIYIGSYQDAGLFHAKFDEKTGLFESVSRLLQLHEVKYLDYNQGILVSLSKDKKGGISILKDNQLEASCHFEATTSCHVHVYQNQIYTSNYHEGTLTKLTYQSNTLKVDKTLDLGPNVGLHQVIGYSGHLIVFCLKLNEMRIYTEDLELIEIISFPKGTGPRHGILNHNKNRLYVLTESSQEIYHFEVNGLIFKLKEVISILNEGEVATHEAAAIRLSENEQWLYTSSRKVNIISVISVQADKIELAQVCKLAYDHPRDILLATDNYLLVAYRDSNCVVSYNLKNGLIINETDKIEIGKAVSLVSGEKYE